MTGSNTAERCHLVLIRMLRIFDSICSRLSIQYWLIDGSLLGAIRHKGFIPWDCDLDIAMTRSDFEIFKKFGRELLPTDIFYQSKDTDHFKFLGEDEVKLRDRFSHYPEWSTKHPESKHHDGLQIDIMVYDYIANEAPLFYNLKTAQKIRKLLKALGFKRTQKNNCASFDYLFYESELFPLRKVSFADITSYIPNQPEKFLRYCYGDYLTLPKEIDRKPNNGWADPLKACNHPESLNWKNLDNF